jgi:hypothetical protein
VAAFERSVTSHYNRGPEVCPHVDQWPMDEIDRELLATIAGDVLRPALTEEMIASARQMFETSDWPEQEDQLRRDLAAVEPGRHGRSHFGEPTDRKERPDPGRVQCLTLEF